ncbi:Uncharacterised protein [Escherichia coli]|nr:Uncharacterised protein [Escherichia coli]
MKSIILSMVAATALLSGCADSKHNQYLSHR